MKLSDLKKLCGSQDIVNVYLDLIGEHDLEVRVSFQHQCREDRDCMLYVCEQVEYMKTGRIT